MGCGALLVISVGAGLLAVGVLYFRNLPTVRRNPSYPGPTRPRRDDVKLVSDHGIETIAKTWNSCNAFAPADWTITGNEQRIGIGVDLAAPGQSMFASYGILSLFRTEMLGANYGTSSPENFLKNASESAGASEFEMEDESQSIEGGYTLRYWRANYRGKPFRGFALYQAIETGDPTNYILAYRMGWTEASRWDQEKHVVYDIAASIRCTKHLFPAQESASSRREPRGSSKDQVDEDISTKREEAMLGFQNVYSPSTGQHWEASYSDYNPTGPDGPGYYRRVGNSYEKLNEGFPPN